MAKLAPSPCRGSPLLAAAEVGGLDWRGKSLAFDSAAAQQGSDRIFCTAPIAAPGALVEDLGAWLASRTTSTGQAPAQVKQALTADLADLPAALRAAAQAPAED